MRVAEDEDKVLSQLGVDKLRVLAKRELDILSIEFEKLVSDYKLELVDSSVILMRMLISPCQRAEAKTATKMIPIVYLLQEHCPAFRRCTPLMSDYGQRCVCEIIGNMPSQDGQLPKKRNRDYRSTF